MADLNLYNNPFNNFTQRTYQPQTMQNRLQNAYNQALNKKTPSWAYTISDMMPSLAEIVAYSTTKNAFNQGRIADSLEREKDRRTAYNQMMRENEDKMVNDYVQMAKEQLGMDMAQDEREYNKELNQLRREDMLEARKQAYNQWLEEKEERERQREIENKWREIDDINKKEALEQSRIQAEQEAKRQAENDRLDRQYKQAQIDKLNRENNPEYIKQQEEQAIKEAEDKANQEQMKKNQERVFTLLNNGSVSPEDAMVINNNPELYKYLKDDSGIKNKIPILGTKKKLELDYEAILKDQNIPVTRKNIKELKKQLGL